MIFNFHLWDKDFALAGPLGIHSLGYAARSCIGFGDRRGTEEMGYRCLNWGVAAKCDLRGFDTMIVEYTVDL